jgi:hypothetical protein
MPPSFRFPAQSRFHSMRTFKPKIGKPTWSKTYYWPHEKQPKKKFGTGPAIHIGTNVKGTNLDGLDSKMANTAPMKLRRETLKKHGVKGLNRTFKK